MQLAVFLGTAAQNFWGGSKTIGLAVQAGPAFYQQHRHLSTFFDTSVGTYATGTEGRLLYHATSVWDYALFYRIGDVALPDALFLCGLGLYLHRALQQLTPGREFSPACARAFLLAGWVALAMFVLKLAFNTSTAAAFAAKTHHAFLLAARSDGALYVVCGLLLVLCANFLQLGTQFRPAK